MDSAKHASSQAYLFIRYDSKLTVVFTLLPLYTLLEQLIIQRCVLYKI